VKTPTPVPKPATVNTAGEYVVRVIGKAFEMPLELVTVKVLVPGETATGNWILSCTGEVKRIAQGSPA
jgi:hypothetical protein